MKTALITGAGSGVGRDTAVALAAAGWEVALVGRRREPLEETAALIGAGHVLPADVTKPEEVTAVFDAAVAAMGRLDLLFNNAGRGAPGKPIDEMPLDDWYGVLDVNLTGAVLCARAAFAKMRAQSPQGGRIINNGSISAYAPRPGSTAYTVTKHAITGLTKCLSLDGRPFDIACGQIDIGNALTDMARPMTKGVPQADGSIAVEATMDPAHVASSVVHMASLPIEANVQFMTVMATKMPFVGRG
ncbi:SDR family oxidoreductase [Paroceanicella profunda]|uniref:SDR family oxidoreductase n=1 Tax=Paroceanicella profunda TaxID=2579971 RepID=A0A5B8FS09_9RHOB|nr:SDR family oxidoreductase [Paroceanicella profunda]QDL91135.1 SDR family oxidoreductase [Paroceanicella profunda]